MAGLSRRSLHAENAIEAEDRFAELLMEKGRKIIALNRGDPAKYLPTPKFAVDAFVKALHEGRTSYSLGPGVLDLKKAVAKRYKRMYGNDIRTENVVITNGVSEAIQILNSAFLDVGDSGILFKPYYPPYMANMLLSGGIPVIERYDESNGWNVHVDSLEKRLSVLKKTGKMRRIKYMMVTNPNNPTGTVLKKDVLERIADIANEYNLLLISDEIYDELTFNGAEYTSMCKVAKGMPYAVLNGMSKNYDSTGFRVGFFVFPNDDKISNRMAEVIGNYTMVRVSGVTPAQYASIDILNNVTAHKQAMKGFVKEIASRVNYATDMLEENPFMGVVRPNGAYYIFPKIDLAALKFKNDREFVQTLLQEEGVQVAWGSGFGEPSHLRIVALAPKETLGLAMEKIDRFCRRHKK